MAARPEVMAQLARMLGDDGLRSASEAEVRAAAEARFDRLVDALVEEIAASDDVTDRESAIDYLQRRLEDLAEVITPEMSERLFEQVSSRLSGW